MSTAEKTEILPAGIATETRQAPKRVRRSAEEARRLILDAAEERLATQGPEGIRLQDIARDVGISHPAILHHFESREGLVRALIARTSAQFRDKMLGALQDRNGHQLEPGELIESVFEALSDRGTARLLSWMMLTDRMTEASSSRALMTEISSAIHSRRVKEAEKNRAPAPDREDTLFMAMLTANAAFGDAIIGRHLAEEAGLGHDGIIRFRRWLAQLLSEHADRHDRPERG
ncbi:TetR/AcrR family transcriptional regulator [Parvibaculum sp.]|uniref:TetR/AcrR family transcriptional regulator n=1 Tax=Parvibaculum sp. TaxID=2024848 RepID=UPI00320C3944